MCLELVRSKISLYRRYLELVRSEISLYRRYLELVRSEIFVQEEVSRACEK